MQVRQNYMELIACGRQHELDEDPGQAIKCYKEAIAQKPVDEFPFTRLMVLYRKEKKYEDELKVINRGIEIFKSFYDKKTQKFTRSNKLGQLSKALLQNLSKGGQRPDEYPSPLPAWLKRKEMVEQKLGSKTAKKKKKRARA